MSVSSIESWGILQLSYNAWSCWNRWWTRDTVGCVKVSVACYWQLHNQETNAKARHSKACSVAWCLIFLLDHSSEIPATVFSLEFIVHQLSKALFTAWLWDKNLATAWYLHGTPSMLAKQTPGGLSIAFLLVCLPRPSIVKWKANSVIM